MCDFCTCYEYFMAYSVSKCQSQCGYDYLDALVLYAGQDILELCLSTGGFGDYGCRRDAHKFFASSNDTQGCVQYDFPITISHLTLTKSFQSLPIH